MAMPFNMPGVPQMQFMPPPGANVHMHQAQNMPPNMNVDGILRQGPVQSQGTAVQQQQTPNTDATQNQQPAAATGLTQLTDLQRETQHLLGELANAPRSSQHDQYVREMLQRPAPVPSTPTHPDRTNSSPRSPAPAQQPSLVQQPQAPSRSAPGPAAAPTDPTRPTPTVRLPSTSNNATNISPAQRLAPTAPSRTASTNVNGTRTSSTSPHRPTRSIGSSWGFSGAENHDDDDDDDDDEEEDDDEDEDTTGSEDESTKGKNLPPKTNGASARSTGREGSSSARKGPGKGKSATVEDLVEDPD